MRYLQSLTRGAYMPTFQCDYTYRPSREWSEVQQAGLRIISWAKLKSQILQVSDRPTIR